MEKGRKMRREEEGKMERQGELEATLTTMLKNMSGSNLIGSASLPSSSGALQHGRGHACSASLPSLF